MEQSIKSLIENGSDFELCDGTFICICDKHGHEIVVEKYSVHERDVILVWNTIGIIGNGGFRYLFESDFPGDPGFVHTQGAFERLGVEPAVTAFKRALAIFSNSRPPNDIRKRMEEFSRVPYSHREKIDEQFWSADEQIVARLAKYIRDHRDAFQDL